MRDLGLSCTDTQTPARTCSWQGKQLEMHVEKLWKYSGISQIRIAGWATSLIYLQINSEPPSHNEFWFSLLLFLGEGSK